MKSNIANVVASVSLDNSWPMLDTDYWSLMVNLLTRHRFAVKRNWDGLDLNAKKGAQTHGDDGLDYVMLHVTTLWKELDRTSTWTWEQIQSLKWECCASENRSTFMEVVSAEGPGESTLSKISKRSLTILLKFLILFSGKAWKTAAWAVWET